MEAIVAAWLEGYPSGRADGRDFRARAGRARGALRRGSGLATRRARILPSFLLIGAQRSGTTSLFYYLRRHPHVATAADEGSPLLRRRTFWRGLDWYRSFFATVGRAAPRPPPWRATCRGGARRRPYYLFHPAVPRAAWPRTIPAGPARASSCATRSSARTRTTGRCGRDGRSSAVVRRTRLAAEERAARRRGEAASRGSPLPQ